jgi:hypothetical protein
MATIDKGFSHFTFDQISSEIDEAFVQVSKDKRWIVMGTGTELAAKG